MEWDLVMRLRMQYAAVDIGPMVGEDFFHLDHVPAWLVARKLTRKTNPMRRPGALT